MSEQRTYIAAGIGATLELFRFSFDLIATASQKSAAAEETIEKDKGGDDEKKDDVNRRSTIFFNGRFSFTQKKPFVQTSELMDYESSNDGEEDRQEEKPFRPLLYAATTTNAVLAIYFCVACALSGSGITETLYSAVSLGCVAVACSLALLLNLRDFNRTRFSVLQRSLHVLCSLILLLNIIILLAMENKTLPALDIISLVALIISCLMAVTEAKVLPYPKSSESPDKKARLNAKVFLTVLKPYFWPDATATSATLNRLRALTTWFCVAAAKTCSLFGPIFLGRATTALAQFNYTECIRNTVIYTVLNFASSFLKEGQSLVYLKVAQAAFVQLSEVSFFHLHSLSLDWHLKKKLGEVIRSMDRGILACDTLMKYLFLWLLPAIAECIIVVVIFATYFDYFPLAVAVFYFVFGYMILTIVVTLWRKKFRKQVAKSDNDWHDRCTDSLVNFETVKYVKSLSPANALFIFIVL